jgi:hypothetical protein
VIRNAVVHITNEQPLLADLYETPNPSDQGLLCTNVRMMDGKRPIFVDRSDSVFFFPYRNIRFVEIMSVATGLPEIEAPAGEARPEAAPVAGPEEAEADLELDEDFLRRIREV